MTWSDLIRSETIWFDGWIQEWARCSAYLTIIINTKVCMVCGTIHGNVQKTATRRETKSCDVSMIACVLIQSICNYISYQISYIYVEMHLYINCINKLCVDTTLISNRESMLINFSKKDPRTSSCPALASAMMASAEVKEASAMAGHTWQLWISCWLQMLILMFAPFHMFLLKLPRLANPNRVA